MNPCTNDDSSAARPRRAGLDQRALAPDRPVDDALARHRPDRGRHQRDADAARDQAHDGVHLARREQVGAEAVAHAGGHHRVEDHRAVVALEAEEALVRELLERHLRGPRERVLLGQRDDQRVALQRAVRERLRHPRRREDEAEIQRADLEFTEDLVGGRFLQRDLDLRKAGHEAAQRARQERVRREADEAERQGARLPLRRIVRAALEQLGARQHGACIVHRLLALARQRDAARVALEQRDAQFRLEFLDRQADRRLRQVEPTRGASEVQFFGDGDQASEMAHFHRYAFWINR